jgi:hypothetical protein
VRFSGKELAELQKRLDGAAGDLSGKELERFEEKLKSGRQL